MISTMNVVDDVDGNPFPFLESQRHQQHNDNHII